jgi:two-component system, NtrC family, response regulator AtoC
MTATGAQPAPLLLSGADEIPPDDVVFGKSPAMDAIRRRVDKIAGADIPVLIRGESGTGKELIARMIHRRSTRAAAPFVKVNCPAIPDTLLESELFGYEKGSFTGAFGSKPGRVEMAHGGTLFLDEIAELTPELQAKLLQLLQDGQFWRIGGCENTTVDVRIICATNRSLEKEMENGRFRRDLFYRVNVVALDLPPLRERKEDLSALMQYFLLSHSRRHNTQVNPPSQFVVRLVHKHHWPGNIRELSNLVERYSILGTEESVTSELLGAMSGGHAGATALVSGKPIELKSVTRRTVQQMERKIILRALIAHRWNRKGAARDLKISYRALLYKIREAGLPSRRPSSNTLGGELLDVTITDRGEN